MPRKSAGVAPGMKLIAVNDRKWTTKILRAAIKAAKADPAPIRLLLEHADYLKTVEIDYHGGERYPDLERDDAKPDLLTPILSPLKDGG